MMQKKLSLFEIEVLMHHHCSGIAFPRIDAPGYSQVKEAFLVEKMLVYDGHGILCTTEKGAAYMEMLCATPFPVQRWVDPRTDTPI